MRDRVRLLFVLVLVSLCLLTIGCLWDDDDDDQSWPATGAIKLSAVADAGTGSFAAASLRAAPVAELRAASAKRFKGCVKIGAAPAKFFDLDLSEDNKKLTLAATLDGVSAGKQQVTIEIIASGVADAEPILKTIATATVAAGSTNEDSIKEAPINYETTAKAIAYETWQASESKSIDDFTPDPTAITALATTIQTTLGGTIDGTKTLNEQAIVDKAKDAADSAENISLVSISLSPTSGSVATNATFNLAGVRVTANYSNYSTNAVTGHTWSVASGGGSLSGSTYTPPTTAGTAVLTCTFIENGATVTANLTLTVTGVSTAIELVNIPSGTFQRDATAANTSYVSAFRMSKYEITREQFLAIMGTDPSDTQYSSGVTDPVQNVNWYHALAYCNKLSIAEGLTPVYSVSGVDFATLTFAEVPTSGSTIWNAATCNWSANGYRLPTEMEWMWAAMGADSGNPGATNTIGYLKAFAGSTGSNLLGDYAWYDDNSSSKTHPAGSKLANELGLFDMSGNVWEWCWGWSDFYPTGAVSEYRGADTGYNRALRGGSWEYPAGGVTVAYRSRTSPYGRNGGIGFRVVRP